MESSKDTRDYKENVLDDNVNGIGGSSLAKKKGEQNSKESCFFGKQDGKGGDDGKGSAGPKAARVSIDVQINH
jgi:hypothetical protein